MDNQKYGIWIMVLGLSSLLLGPITGIPGIILGHYYYHRNPGKNVIVTIGIISSYVSLVFTISILAIYLYGRI